MLLAIKKNQLIIAVAFLFLLVNPPITKGQTTIKPGEASGAAAVTEATQSLGVGMESRFTAGSKPIVIDRVKITPGTPMTVKPTMDNMITSEEEGSFGGILGRYDTSTFGKFFESGSLNTRATTAARARLDLSLGDNTLNNAGPAVPRMYPPRLYVDFAELPVSNTSERQVRLNIAGQVKNMLTRFGTDPQRERVELVFLEDSVVLQGQIRLMDHSVALENVLAMEPGVERVVNRLVVLESPRGSDSPLTIPVQ